MEGGAVTVQTPTHVHPLLRFCHRHLANLTVTGLAIQPIGNMWAVAEVHKVGHDRHRHPRDRFAALHISRVIYLIQGILLRFVGGTPSIWIG